MKLLRYQVPFTLLKISVMPFLRIEYTMKNITAKPQTLYFLLLFYAVGFLEIDLFTFDGDMGKITCVFLL